MCLCSTNRHSDEKENPVKLCFKHPSDMLNFLDQISTEHFDARVEMLLRPDGGGFHRTVVVMTARCRMNGEFVVRCEFYQGEGFYHSDLENALKEREAAFGEFVKTLPGFEVGGVWEA